MRFGRLLVVLGCLVLVACSPAPDPDPTTPLAWQPCQVADAGLAVRCAWLSVPVDPAKPDSPRIRLRVARLPAARPQQRIGVLVVNPGGPGASSVGLVTDTKVTKNYFPQALLDRFDLVQVDGRGVGGSAPVTCSAPLHDPGVDLFPTTSTAAAALAVDNKRFSTSCSGPAVSDLDTEAVASDLDAVRVALGEKKISFLGLSYGTMVAQAYAENYGTHVRAMVVDGVVDRSLDWRALVLAGARAVGDSFQRFAAWCRTATTCHRDANALLADVLSAADDGKLAGTTSDDLVMAINGGLHSSDSYPDLATRLIAAHDHADPSGLLALVPWAAPGYYQAYRAIICQDVPVDTLAPADTQRVRDAEPLLRGESEFWEIASGCAGWPVAAHWQPHPWHVPAGFPGALVASTEHDPVTPLVFAQSVARQIPGSHLLTSPVDGHTVWLNDPATRSAEVQYLINDRT